jgi:hypothetical protein
MFAIDCIKTNGTHLGTCIDKFYFGSCCQVKVSSLTVALLLNVLTAFHFHPGRGLAVQHRPGGQQNRLELPLAVPAAVLFVIANIHFKQKFTVGATRFVQYFSLASIGIDILDEQL